MLTVDISNIGIHWQFSWIYKTVPTETPNKFRTITYIRHKVKGDEGKGSVLGSHVTVGNYDKDECRIDTLLQALDTLTAREAHSNLTTIYKEVLSKYASQSRVPKPGTKLGEWQRWLKGYLEMRDVYSG